jgi:hypothetical protein
VCANSREIRIDITSTRTPIIRVGWGNMLLFHAIVASLMLHDLLTDIQASFLCRVLGTAVIGIAFLALYLRFVSQVRITEGGELTIETPIRRTRMDLARIERIRIYTVPTSKSAVLWIIRRDRTLPAFYTFVAFNTNCGSFGETIDKLSRVLKTRGVGEDRR